MGLLENAQNPHLTLAEQAADVATPGAGLWRIFTKSDGLYLVDDAGTVVGPLGTAASGGGSAFPLGDPDEPPSSPSAYDDEFEAALSGWTTMGAPAVMDANSTIPGHLYIKPTVAVGDNAVGLYKAPPAVPFTATAKVSDAALTANYNRVGLFIGTATPGSYSSAMVGFTSGTGVPVFANGTGSSPTSSMTLNGGAAATELGHIMPVYLRVRVNSATSVDYMYAVGGRAWRPIRMGINPGFTIGSVGLFAQSHNASAGGEAAFDWIRFT